MNKNHSVTQRAADCTGQLSQVYMCTCVGGEQVIVYKSLMDMEGRVICAMKSLVI